MFKRFFTMSIQLICKSNYLTNSQLEALKQYKYHGVDTNPFNNYFAMPICDKIVLYIPVWLAPNIITLGTLWLSLVHYFILMYYDYDLIASTIGFLGRPKVSNWVWLFSSICLLLCLIFDALDGKHARRINACSPIGELLDHGVDSFRLMAPLLTCVASLFGQGEYGLSPMQLLCMLLALQSATALTLWQQYFTKIMVYNWTYDIAQYYIVGFYFITFCRGGAEWWQCKAMMFNSNADIFHHFLYIFLCTISPYHQISSFARWYKKRENNLNLNAMEILRPFIQPLLLTTFALLWAFCSTADILELDTRAFLWLISTLYSNSMYRLMLNTMTNTKCDTNNNYFNLNFLTVLLCLTIPKMTRFELLIVRFLPVTATFYHINYVASTIFQISRYLDIPILTVKK